MRAFKYIVIVIATLIFVAGIGVCLWMAGTKSLNSNDSLLLGVFVSLLSILASWLVSHVYAELSVRSAREDARDNLRMYALKAAEKVTNLSNELSKLGVYLQAELDDNSYGNLESDLQGKNERIQSAIHLIQTLKSVNDGSLSDWKGVIGEELESQREQEREREEEVADLIERMDTLSAAIDEQGGKEEILQLRREIRNLASALGGRAIMHPANPRRNVSIRCPRCEGTLSYRQRPKTGSFKVVDCPVCKGKFVSSYDGTNADFVLEPRRVFDETVKCPHCGAANQVAIENVPATHVKSQCTACQRSIRVSRTAANRIRVAKVVDEPNRPPASALTDEIISSVRSALPQQPWPKHIHQKIASDLHISNSMAHKAIRELIRRGEVRNQINGELVTEDQFAEPDDEEIVGS